MQSAATDGDAAQSTGWLEVQLANPMLMSCLVNMVSSGDTETYQDHCGHPHLRGRQAPQYHPQQHYRQQITVYANIHYAQSPTNTRQSI